MASLTQIRDAIKATLVAALPGVNVYARVVDVDNVPAIVVGPPKADYMVAMRRGLDEWMFDLYVLVGIPELAAAQQNLDQYVTGAGPKSVREVIFNNSTLGGVVEDSVITKMEDYGGAYKAAGIPHIGACLKLTVLTDGNG